MQGEASQWWYEPAPFVLFYCETLMRSFFHTPKQLLLGTMLAAAVSIATTASAQAYPDRTIEWVVPYPAGGGTDIVARTLAQAMSDTLKQSMVIVNKPGAATNIGAEYVARAKND